MADSKKITPYLSATAGSTFGNWLRMVFHYKIPLHYWLKMTSVTLTTLAGLPFQLWERIKFDKKVHDLEMTSPPVFILGHWRSGTTLLHYLLGKDPQMGYVSTYQTFFPEYLASENLFKSVMQKLAPGKRLVDNMRVAPDLPNEEEFGLGNTWPYSFFHCFYFPEEMENTFRKAVLMEELKDKEQKSFEESYLRLLKKAQIHSGKSQLVIKNPANTARIPTLLKLFPNAKFIYIHRDPITVFYSTLKLWRKTMPALTFQEVSEEKMKNHIILFYRLLMENYRRNRPLIPEENLIEIRFEEFEKDKMGGLQDIYASLNLDGFETARPFFESYLESVKGYKKNKFKPEPEMVMRLKKEWAELLTDP